MPGRRREIENSFPFLKLPAEIRNMIYEIWMTNNRDPNDRTLNYNYLSWRSSIRKHGHLDATRLINSFRKEEPLFASEPLLCTNTLLTCRQVYDEAIGVFYTVNIFFVTFVEGYYADIYSFFEKFLLRGLKVYRIKRLTIEYKLCLCTS